MTPEARLCHRPTKCQLETHFRILCSRGLRLQLVMIIKKINLRKCLHQHLKAVQKVKISRKHPIGDYPTFLQLDIRL